jgi:DNA-binding NarL/FixJ family response regulator
VIRVLIADDQALVRAGFRMILDAEEDLDVVGEASDGAEAVEQTRRLDPDVVLMDIPCRSSTASRPRAARSPPAATGPRAC